MVKFFSFKTQSGRENFIEKSFLVEKGAFINRRKVSRMLKNTIMDEPFEESARKTKTEIPAHNHTNTLLQYIKLMHIAMKYCLLKYQK